MIQRDFVLRLIEQLGAMVRAFVSGRMTKADVRESQALLENAAEQGLGLPYSTLLTTSPDELLQLFQSGGGTFESRTALAGCILAAAARGRRPRAKRRKRMRPERRRFIYSNNCARTRRSRKITELASALRIS